MTARLEGEQPSIDEALAAARSVKGWLTDGQAGRLYQHARAVPAHGRVVEIGSFQGRSTIVLALGAPPSASIVAIDPHLGSDRGPREIAANPEIGEGDALAFSRNLADAGVAERVQHVRLRSQEALGCVHGAIDLLYVDGAHRYRPALEDIAKWGAKVPLGGTMLVHDAFSSIGVTLALARTTVFSSRWRYVGREGSLAEFKADRLSTRARARNAAEQLAHLPFFGRNIALKVLVVARLRSGPFPY